MAESSIVIIHKNPCQESNFPQLSFSPCECDAHSKADRTVVASPKETNQAINQDTHGKDKQIASSEAKKFQWSKMSANKRVVISALGIFVCHFYFGILQEKITRGTYGQNDKFTFTFSLIFIQSLVSAIFAKIMLHTFMKHGEDGTKQWYYATTGLSYLSAMYASTQALQHVNYPTQVVGKSCKPIPVMIMGVLCGRKTYPLAKYFFVFTIVIGVCIFMYKDKPAVSDLSNAGLIGMGEILLMTSLLLDGTTGVLQERTRAAHKSKPAHMMYGTNMWSILFLGIAVLVTEEVWSFLQFVEKYPYVIYNILSFSIMCALGQVFIFLVVSEFGPLLVSIITTTRKFFTVLGSVFLFGNVLTGQQWFGTALVFTGLLLDAVYGKPPKKPPKEESCKERV